MNRFLCALLLATISLASSSAPLHGELRNSQAQEKSRGVAPEAASKTHMFHFCRALGDSLTAGFIDKSTNILVSYPSYLQTMGSCAVVSNEGVSGQLSTEIAVRSGGVGTTATIVGGVIPPLGSVNITFKPGYEPTTHYSTFGVPMSISGVAGVVAHIGSSDVFTRSTPGMPVASTPNSPVTIITGSMNDGFVIIWAGKNNATNPDQVLSDIAAIVNALPNPKRFVVLAVTNSDVSSQWKGGTQYNGYLNLDASLASVYPKNFLDIRSLLVAAYDHNNPQDVIDHNHDVIPASLRYFEDSTLAAPVPDTSSCTAIPSPTNSGNSVQIDHEKIYISYAVRGFAVYRGCIRGYAGTVAATHDAGAPVRTLDPTHLNAAGQMFVANKINAWMIANPTQSAR